MKKNWFPERHHGDAVNALLRNFIDLLHYRISKPTIEQTYLEFIKTNHITLESMQVLLKKLGIECLLYNPDSTQLSKIPSPSILTIQESLHGLKTTRFIVFTGAKNGMVKYLHTQKGFVRENEDMFIQKWNKTALTAISVNASTEHDYDEKEKAWSEKKQSHPALKNIQTKKNFLTPEECEHIIKISGEKFSRSTVMGIENNFDNRRTSFTAKLNLPDDKILESIRHKAAKLIDMPAENFELFQCVSYAQGQEFDVHYDTLDEIQEKELIEKEGQRKFTLLAYLNDGYEGGETHFPHLDLLIQPVKGSLLIFNNLDENGKVIKEMLHAGKPVWEGQKFAMNMWVRTKKQEL